MTLVLSLLAVGLMAMEGALAHPGHGVAQEAAHRGNWLRSRNPNSVRNCAAQLRKRGHLENSIARRQAMANKARVKRNLPQLVTRDFATYNISHASDKNVTLGTDELELFHDNSSCVLQPEVTQGPYYVDGELIRRDMRENQEGVPLFLDVQIIDTSTCEPVPAVFMDAWHCNATGVYSGVSASGNGNSDDTSNLNATFLRGIQLTDINGVAQFESIVPGYYTGRAPHIHILTHNINETTIRTNGTLLGSNQTVHASHVGQIFFDQDLLTQVFATTPYNANTQELTTNDVDGILIEETAGMDPFVEYVLVNPDNIADGVLAWISLGIDPSKADDVTAAATIYETGGVANANSGMGGPPPPGGGDGTAPSGPPPA